MRKRDYLSNLHLDWEEDKYEGETLPSIEHHVSEQGVEEVETVSSTVSSVPEPLPYEDRQASKDVLLLADRKRELYLINSRLFKKRFLGTNNFLIFLNVSTIFLALLSESLPQVSLPFQFDNEAVTSTITLLLIVLPIVTSTIIDYSASFRFEKSHILLLQISYSLDREISLYRSRVLQYRTDRNMLLARSLAQANKTLENSSVYETGFRYIDTEYYIRRKSGIIRGLLDFLFSFAFKVFGRLYEELFGGDPIVSRLKDQKQTSFDFDIVNSNDNYPERLTDYDPVSYMDQRLKPILEAVRINAFLMGQRIHLSRILIYVTGAAGTFLAAIGVNTWVAFTTALTLGLTNYSGVRGSQYRMSLLNELWSDLDSIFAWWKSLSDCEQANPANFERMIVTAEEFIYETRLEIASETGEIMSESITHFK